MSEQQQDNVQTPESPSTSVQSNVQEEENITTTEKPKEKDPKRVAAGKRLAAISKAAKEKKMRELLENSDSSLSWKQYAILGLGSGILSYFVYRRFISPKKKKEDENEDEIKLLNDLKPVHKTMRKHLSSRGKPISMFD